MNGTVNELVGGVDDLLHNCVFARIQIYTPTEG